MSENSTQLSFCQITRVNDFVVELVTNPEVELGGAEVIEFHQYFDNLDAPVGLLVNRVNSYSYSFETLRSDAKNKNMAAIAVLLNDTSKLVQSEYIVNRVKTDVDANIFFDRDSAISWLESFQC